MEIFTFIVVIVYLLAIGYLGYLGYRSTKTAADYLVAGRNANPVVMALSYGATFISTSAIVGFGGVAANFGMGLLWLTVCTRVGIVVGLVAALILGKMVRGNIIALATAIFFGVCASAFLPSFVGCLFWKRMTRPGAIASIITGLLASLFWMAFINAKTATGLGICQALFGKALLLPNCFSPTWSVVDPLLVALPLSAAAALIVSLATPRLPQTHLVDVFGGEEPPQDPATTR